ncbi:galactose oxidase [Rhizophagus irregularis]|uniref:Galactose oxidase n=1 Tax=Rhizophagus irregularis TaxID=588596 RepID=A0A2N0RRV5_9GLOM|nr:galactose oxidase [Rhizophagus irregularis]PKC66015.1 galactose oxidase [Rhizophagus irregularis]CAB5327282.1 unnamed protein product [Rhizophagus irregularis]
MVFLYNSLIYIIVFGAFLQLLVEVKSQLITYKPDLRYAHTATLIEDKIYILGGAVPPRADNGLSPKETFLYLDVSTPFSTNEVKYIDISNNNAVPSHRYAIATKGGTNNSTLFLYGGDNFANQTKELVYTFDAQHSTWSVPKITGDPDPPKGTSYMFPVIDYNELFYLFGGSFPYVNDMHILDTINLSWKKASSIGAPSERDNYGAVFLPNKKIIYIGGYGNGLLPLNEVFLYDTINNSWERKETDGIVPTPRAAFSAILGLDGQSVIIFGGESATPLSREIALYVLNLNKFRWRVPGISGKIPASRSFHRTLLIGNYMVVTFGLGYMREDDNDILLLDISNNDEYAWTTSFVPPSLTSQLPTSQSPTHSSSHSNINTIGGISIGVICGIALTVGGFFLYKQYKNRKERSTAISTPGNE